MADLDRVFAALSDPTRRAIVARLSRGAATVGDLALPFEISQPAVSRHLKVLEDAGLIAAERRGAARPRHLRTEALNEIALWLEPYRQLWEARFERLDGVLEEMKAHGGAPQGKENRKGGSS